MGRGSGLFPPPGGESTLRAFASAFAKPTDQMVGAAEDAKKMATAEVFSNVFDLKEYDSEHPLRFGDLEVSFVAMRHLGGAYGMRITD